MGFNSVVWCCVTADPRGVISPLAAVATVGDAVTFTCNVSGYPLPGVSRWTLANGRVDYYVGAQEATDRVQVCLELELELKIISVIDHLPRKKLNGALTGLDLGMDKVECCLSPLHSSLITRAVEPFNVFILLSDWIRLRGVCGRLSRLPVGF